MTDRTSPASLFGLARGGVCRASLSPGCWWALTPPFHPYLEWWTVVGGRIRFSLSVHRPPTTVHHSRRYPFCCTFPVLRRPKDRLGPWALPTTVPFEART